MKTQSVQERDKASKSSFRDNKDSCRYELDLGDGYVAKLDYHVTDDNCVALTHTYVPREFEGHGYASELVKYCLEDIRDRNSMVIPLCGFVTAYMRRHPEWDDLVARRFL